MKIAEILSQRRNEIELEIRALRAELTQIKVAEDAIAGLSPAVLVPASERLKRRGRTVRDGSIKAWVLKALEDAEHGHETDNVIGLVRLLGGPDVSRSSMTPQLSRLKQAGLVILDGRRWKLPKYAPRPPWEDDPDHGRDEPDFSNAFGSDGGVE